MFARDAAVALTIVAAILVGMFAYTGLWPPLVVVESNSMMHSEDNVSYVGVIDTGDLVLVKKIERASDIKTYMDGYASGYKTYGDFGDVIIYEKDGSSTSTPIIHRAMIYLEANPDGQSYSAPALENIPKGKWITDVSDDAWDHITSTLTIIGVGYRGIDVPIDITNLLHGGAAESGFITKGDHNQMVDVNFGGPGVGYRPIDVSWVVGKARGEIPWFGLLKLWSTGTLNSVAPENSVRNLWITIAIIVIAPIIVDISMSMIERRKRRRWKEAADKMKEEPSSMRKDPDAEDASSRAVEPPETQLR